MTRECLALELAADRIAVLEHDCVVYRELLQLTLHKLAAVSQQRDRLSEQLRELRREQPSLASYASEPEMVAA